jgi:hypothetical protein
VGSRCLPQAEQFYNAHRPHQGIANVWPLHAFSSPIPELAAATHLYTGRRDRLSGLHEYRHAARPARMRFPASIRSSRRIELLVRDIVKRAEAVLAIPAIAWRRFATDLMWQPPT